MHRLGVRIGLVVGFLAGVAAAGYQVFVLEQKLATVAEARRAFDAAAWQTLLATTDLSGSARSYVAEGQREQFWLERAATQFSALREDLSRLRRTTRQPEVARALDQAAAALDAFAQADERARQYVASGQRLMASDVIFSDGLTAAATARRQISEARTRENLAAEAEAARLHMHQLAWLLGAAGLALLVVFLLAPAAAPKALAPVEAMATHEPRPHVPTSDLKTAAELCTDLGRVAETADLPPLLERAARLLDASGLVVWLLDHTGATLRPLAAHGYTPHELDRMGAVPRDADNAVGIAFRTRKLQIVPSTERDDGALVVPLMTPTGCAGVLAAEVQRGTEGSEAVSALAVILAAQIAALVGSAPQAQAASADAAWATGA